MFVRSRVGMFVTFEWFKVESHWSGETALASDISIVDIT